MQTRIDDMRPLTFYEFRANRKMHKDLVAFIGCVEVISGTLKNLSTWLIKSSRERPEDVRVETDGNAVRLLITRYDARGKTFHWASWTVCLFKESPPMRTCRVCGCTQGFACREGCIWVGPDLCSRCDEP